MDKKSIEASLNKVLEEKGNKKFTQTIDLIIKLKDLDLKKNDQQIDFFINLPFSKGKEAKICGLVGPELVSESQKHFDHTIEAHDFDALKSNSKEIKKLAETYDYFVAQATIMPQVATVFGRILGSRGKMPNPKAGCVVPPKAQLGPLAGRLKQTVRVSAKTSLVISVPVGKENQEVSELVENIDSIYKGVVSHAVQGENNFKSAALKLTMGKLVRID